MTNFQTSIWQNIAIFLTSIHKRLANKHALILAQVIQNVGPTGLKKKHMQNLQAITFLPIGLAVHTGRLNRTFLLQIEYFFNGLPVLLLTQPILPHSHTYKKS